MDFNKIFLYLNSLNLKNQYFNDFYNEIINFENIHFIPAVRIDTAIFLNFICSLLKPKNILEIGFGSGVSTIFIYKSLEKYENFISLEKDKNRYIRGKNLLQKYSIENINLINEDSFIYLNKTQIKFDFIFLDAVKREYIDYIIPIKNNLIKNGLLIVDNILFNGKIVDDNIEEKYVNGINLLKQFNNKISEDLNFFCFFLAIGDGLLLAKKIK